MTRDDRNYRDRDDEWMNRLLGSSGRGPAASPEAKARIYAAVRERWQSTLPGNAEADEESERSEDSRHGRPPAGRRVSAHRPWRSGRGWKKTGRLALVAGLAAAAIIVYRLQSPPMEADVPFATVAKSAGGVDVRRGDVVRPIGPRGLQTLRVGDALTTGAEGRVALELMSGQHLRIDSRSEISVAGVDLVELRAGRVYFDSEVGDLQAQLGDSEPSSFRLDTRFGLVEHVGTQYEAGLVGAGLRVRVREGAVVIRDDARRLTASAGDEVEITASGAPRRTTIAADDPAWQWVEDLATIAPAAEYRLNDVLQWVSRETGHALEFGAGSEARARSVVLYGLAGLSPRETLDVLRSTTAFDYVVTDQTLLVSESGR